MTRLEPETTTAPFPQETFNETTSTKHYTEPDNNERA